MNSTALAEQVLQSFRSWLKSNGTAAGLTDAQVWVDSSKGPRPPLPYIGVRAPTTDIVIGSDEVITRIGDTFEVGDGDPDDVYELTINDVAISYTRTDDDTNDTVAAAIVALINSDDDLDKIHAEVDATAADPTFWVAASSGSLVTSTVDAKLTRTEDGATTEEVIGVRRTTMSVQAYGDTAAKWLERATWRLALEEVILDLEAAGLSIVPTGGMTDLAKLLDTSIEARVLREFDVSYAIRTEPTLKIPLESAVITATTRKSSGDADTLTTTITVGV